MPRWANDTAGPAFVRILPKATVQPTSVLREGSAMWLTRSTAFRALLVAGTTG